MIDSKELMERVARIIGRKKGKDITIIDVTGLSSFADYFINVTAGNVRQLEAFVDEVTKKVSGMGGEIKNVEGKANSGWILVDCGDVIVNVFGKEEREKYQLEKIWSDGKITEYESDEFENTEA